MGTVAATAVFVTDDQVGTFTLFLLSILLLVRAGGA